MVSLSLRSCDDVIKLNEALYINIMSYLRAARAAGVIQPQRMSQALWLEVPASGLVGGIVPSLRENPPLLRPISI